MMITKEYTPKVYAINALAIQLKNVLVTDYRNCIYSLTGKYPDVFNEEAFIDRFTMGVNAWTQEFMLRELNCALDKFTKREETKCLLQNKKP